ncbi:hypothetical protein [Xenorhabdus bovienii]|uniref:hypothetical protein n=1 Tax=Xenorhabdus bovienii TaxID=40576 RepID=UPI0023B3598A|nr:hypothetical protein [Xenorhabdus bovienii]MDE9484085.1 hypothetical protein [Xenorhabdus bovienii]
MCEYKSGSESWDTTNFISDNYDNRFTVQLGEYNPCSWNEYIEINNCYSYACNIIIKRKDGDPPNPGYCENKRKPEDEEETIKGAEGDGLIKISSDMKYVTGTDKNPVWIVGLVTYHTKDTNEFGYHWYRRVWDKQTDHTFWAHKFYTDPVNNLSIDGGLIMNPEEESKKLSEKHWDSYKWGGYFLVPNGVFWEDKTRDTTICNC